MNTDPDDTRKQIIKSLSKMTKINKKQYIADVRVMNYLLQAIPNDIYNSVDACKTAKEMWERIKRLLYGFDVTNHCQSTPSFSIACNLSGANILPWFVTTKQEIQFHMISFSCKSFIFKFTITILCHEEDYQGELPGDSQEDKLTTAMMLLARAITQKFSIPIDNGLRTSSNTRNQAVIQDGRVYIQTKNTGYGGHGNRNAWRQNRNQAFNA
ncbi:hypothetical protein Tco_1089223 [Tanacetum coccineum]